MVGQPQRTAPTVPGLRPYPFAYPIVFVGLVWATVELHPAALLRPLLAGLLIAAVLVIALTLAFRDRDRGAFLAALALAALILDDTRVLVVAIVLAGVVVAESVIHRGQPWRHGPRVTRVMTVISVVLLLALGIKVVQDGAVGRAIEDVTADAVPRPSGPANSAAPDIYIVLLDGFPGGRTTTFEGAAARELGEALAAREFAVQPDSHSNYMYTGQTLASMLSMRHLHDIEELAAPSAGSDDDSRRLRRVMAKGIALDTMAEHGYELIAIPSGFDHVDLRRVDRQLSPGQPTEFEIAMLGVTPIGRLVETVAPDLPSQLQRDRIHETFRVASDLSREEAAGPRFVLVHVPAPHPPWVFGPAGESRRARLDGFFTDDTGWLGIDRQTAYTRAEDQSRHIATLTLTLVDQILAGTQEREPVVVVMSDHGTGIGLNAPDTEPADIVERFSNVMAIHAPGQPGILDRRLTPVNLFPRLFAAYGLATFEETDDGLFASGEERLTTRRISPVPEWGN